MVKVYPTKLVMNQEQVNNAEQALTQAMLKSDIVALEQLLADSLLFTNHLGMLIRKQDDINLHKQGIVQIHEIDASEQHIELYPRFAVGSVKLHIIGSFQQQVSEADFRFTRVWQQIDNNKLQLVGGHSCLIHDAASE